LFNIKERESGLVIYLVKSGLWTNQAWEELALPSSSLLLHSARLLASLSKSLCLFIK